MLRRVSRTRSGVAGSLLILLSVLLLAAVGGIYVAEPAAANSLPCQGDEIYRPALGDGNDNGVTYSIAWPTSKKVTWAAPAGGSIHIYVDAYGDYVTGWNDLGVKTGAGSFEVSGYGFYITKVLICGIPNGTIIIQKATNPAGGAGFAFEANWDGYYYYPPSDFVLGDGGSTTQADVTPGSYTVGEEGLPSHWYLSSISCDDGASQTPSTWSVSNRQAYIKLDPGETVTCTFTNTKKGQIIVDKVTDPTTGNDPNFGFEADYIYEYGADFTLDDNDAPRSDYLLPGTYEVEEVSLPQYWELDSAVCSDGSDPSAIALEAGEVVTCTFTNSLQDPKITVIKRIDRDGDGVFEDTAGSGEYRFCLDAGAAEPGPCLDTDESGQVVFDNVSGGSHEVTELQLDTSSGVYVFKSGSGTNCTFDGETATATVTEASITPGVCAYCHDCGCPPVVTPPVDATCTFENGPEPGELIIVKVAEPEDDTPFPYTAAINTQALMRLGATQLDPFVLTDPSDNSKLLVGSGIYQIVEGDLPYGWIFDDVVCEGTDAWSHQGPALSVEVRDSEQVTCYFYNYYGSRIIVKKVTDPAGAPGSFLFDTSWGADFYLGDGGVAPSPILLPGDYAVGEILSPAQVAAGWSLASAVCSDGSDPSNISLGRDEVVTCTFTNRRQPSEEGGSLIIRKVTTVPGGPAFGFQSDLGPFSLSDGQERVFSGLGAGSYGVSEPPVMGDGWSLIDVDPIVCETTPGVALDVVYAPPGVTVNLAQGQTVTCTFYNENEEDVAGPEGSLTIIKRTVPAGGEGFAFDAGALGAFTLDDGGMQQFTELEPGAYTVTETPAEGWEFASIECDALDYVVDGSSVTVNLAEGEAAVCTFTNGELPYTGSPGLTMPLLLSGLWALLTGLGLWVWSLMRAADRSQAA